MPKPIYVEILIDAPPDDVWEKSQDPSMHQRWDLRFSAIARGEPGVVLL